VELRIGWTVAALCWRFHAPTALNRCGGCGLPSPCWSARFADDFLNATVSPPQEPAAQTTRDAEPIPTS